MSKQSIQIDEQLYIRAAAKAARQGRSIDTIVETSLRNWVGPEPSESVSFSAPQPATRAPTQEQIYVVKYGDTLAQIALKLYGDAKKYVLIAQHNGITDPAQIRGGQALRIPALGTAPESTASAPTAQPIAAPTAGQRFRFPLNKEETNYYKFGSLYAGNSRWAGKPHPGVDFHEFKGANVYAIGEGTVVLNKQDPSGYGHYMMIEHTLTTGPKIYSLYAHLTYDDEAFQSPLIGTQLKGENTIIGKEGDTGYAGVPHLHFEIKKTAQLGLYPMITTYNLNEYFDDPYVFIRDPNNLLVPA